MCARAVVIPTTPKATTMVAIAIVIISWRIVTPCWRFGVLVFIAMLIRLWCRLHESARWLEQPQCQQPRALKPRALRSGDKARSRTLSLCVTASGSVLPIGKSPGHESVRLKTKSYACRTCICYSDFWVWLQLAAPWLRITQRRTLDQANYSA
jgi:hypothetical protein